MQFGNAVDEAAEQIARAVRLMIPVLIAGGVVETEIRAEIDEGNAARDDVSRKILRLAMGEGGEDQADPVERFMRVALYCHVRIGQSEMGMHVLDRGAGLAV